MGARFIVTDLEVVAPFDLSLLAGELDLHLFPDDEGVSRIRGSPSNGVDDPAGQINELLGLVRNLTPAGRDLWDRSTYRIFDVGFERSDEHHVVDFELSAELIQGIASVQGILNIAIYRDGDDDEEDWDPLQFP